MKINNRFYQQIKDYLAELLAEEALDYPDCINNTNGVSRKEMIERLTNIIYEKNHLSFAKNKNITIRYYHNKPNIYNDYNECDTAFGKQRLSSFEYNEPFVEEIYISRHEKERIVRRILK